MIFVANATIKVPSQQFASASVHLPGRSSWLLLLSLPILALHSSISRSFFENISRNRWGQATENPQKLILSRFGYGRHVARLHIRRHRYPPRAYAPTSNTASHYNHEKINSWVSFVFLYSYGAPLGGPSGRRSSAIIQESLSWYFIVVYIINRILHGCLQIRILSSRIELCILLTFTTFKSSKFFIRHRHTPQ